MRLCPRQALPCPTGALTRALIHPWQYLVLAAALVLMLPLRRSVVLTLLSAAAVGVIIALAAGTVSP